MTPLELRRQVRGGHFRQPTAGYCGDHAQANLVILPQQYAADFLLFCQRNPRACPLLAVGTPGQWDLPALGHDMDLRSDVPGYNVYRHGELVAQPQSLHELWRDDLVVFAIGCSFSFEQMLIDAGIVLRHVAQRRNVAMYRTSLACVPSGPFHGNMVVSMRPIKSRDVARVVEVSGRFALAHGAPLHIGNPAEIGIKNLLKPDYGDAVSIMPDEVPVFWACGVTPQWIAQSSRLSLCITHAPGKMFVTDRRG